MPSRGTPAAFLVPGRVSAVARSASGNIAPDPDDGRRLDRGVWDYLAGTVSQAFKAGGSRRVAVNLMDERGNGLMVVKDLDEVAAEL